MNEIIIALGTNLDEDKNITRMKSSLKDSFPNICFTDAIRTHNVGSSIYGDHFTNALAKFRSALSLEQITDVLKQKEKECGDSRELRLQGIVKADIDLLSYAGHKHHVADWEREYIKQLITTL